MNRAKCCDADYIDFLITTPRAASCCEASRSGPEGPDPAAHDAYTRPLHRLEPDLETLWAEVEPLVRKDDGVLILDDSTLDKLYARKIRPVHRHWSGKHRKAAFGRGRSFSAAGTPAWRTSSRSAAWAGRSSRS